MYYKLDTDRMELTAFVTKEEGPAIFSMSEGRPYEMDAGEEPFFFTFEDWQDPPLLDYISGKCLMSRELVQTIEAAGVDSLQKFDATLKDTKTGEINNSFVVVNVVGLVEAADLDSSESIPLGSGEVFTDLVVDQDKAHGLLMFRLAESRSDIIVHERVAKAIESGSFRGVLLSPVS